MDSGIIAYLMVGSRSLAVGATVKQSGRIATLEQIVKLVDYSRRVLVQAN